MRKNKSIARCGMKILLFKHFKISSNKFHTPNNTTFNGIFTPVYWTLSAQF